MTEKEQKMVERGRLLVTNQWVDNEERTWKFECGLGEGCPITVYVDDEKFIDNEQVLNVYLDSYTYLLFRGEITLGQIVEYKTVLVNYKDKNYILKKI